MSSMKQDSTLFDNQIRQMLDGHTTVPSPALRDALMSRLTSTPPRKKAWYLYSRTYWLAAAILLFPVSFYLFSIFNPFNNSETIESVGLTDVRPVNNRPSQPETDRTPETKNAIVEKEINSDGQDKVNSGTEIKSSDTPSHSSTHNEIIAHSAKTGTQEQPDDRNKPKWEKGVVATIDTRTSETDKPFNLFLPLHKSVLFPSQTNKTVINEILTVNKPVRSRMFQDDLPQPTSFSRYEGSISLGASYTPEIMFNILDGDQKFVHNAALELLFHYHNFTIRTGVGLAFAKGTSALGVKYNLYKGSFQHLDSLDFYYDDETGQVVGVYHLSEKNVYDSVSQNVITEIKKNYTYLQIPLLFGYRFFEQNRFGISVTAGPTLSILLDEKETSDYDPGRNLIINTTTLSPDRIKTNWQFSAGIGFSYHLTSKLYFELEPRVKYYFNSVYEKAATTKKPWSLELRSGLLYTL